VKKVKKHIISAISIVTVIALFAVLFATKSSSRSALGASEAFALAAPSGIEITSDIAENEVMVFSENGRSMYVSHGGAITVRDTLTNAVLWRNTAGESDKLVYNDTEAASSPISITYRQNGETDTELFSSLDSVASDQYTVGFNEDGTRLQVIYLLGEAGDGGLLPKALTKDFMENEIFKNISSDEVEFLEERYILYKAGKAESIFMEEIPGMKTEDIYYLEFPGSFVIQNKIISYLAAGGLNEESYKKQCEITGEKALIYNENFMLTVEYWLENGDVMVNIPSDSIYYHSEHPLTLITLNGACTYAEKEQSGKYLLPAGSGALQSFCDGDERNNNYTYYGTDYLNTVSTAKETEFPLPVFATIREGGVSVLGIIESGAEAAVLNERFTNGASQLNLSLRLLEYGDASVTAQQTSTVYCTSQFKDNFTVRYCIIEDETDPIALAGVYRSLLLSQNKLPEKAKSTAPALVEIVGNVPYSYQWCGLFMVNKQIVLTDWQQAGQIASAFYDSGVTPAVKLSGFNKNGLFRQNLGSYSFFGSKADRTAFLKAVSEKGISTYLNVNLVYNYGTSLFGYNASKHSARAPGNDNGERFVTSKSTGEANKKALTLEIASSKMFERYAKSYNKLDAALGIGLNDATNSLNTDFSEKTPQNRSDAIKSIKKASGILAEERLVMVKNPITPLLNDISICEDLTLTGLKQYSFSEYVPFVQAVLHGHINYTSDALNAYNDYNKSFLEAISLGAIPKYTVCHSFERDIMSTEYDFLYFTDWGNWKQTILADSQKASALYEKIYAAQITAYKNENGVSVTEYSNGVKGYVNITDREESINGVTVAANSFTVQ